MNATNIEPQQRVADVVVAGHVEQRTTDQRADDADHGREDAPRVGCTLGDRSRERAGDEADDDPPEAHATYAPRRRPSVTHAVG